jgi:hypothetical protein
VTFRTRIKIKFRFFSILLALLAGVGQTAAQGTAFSYQGRLNAGTSPAGGSYDLTFALFNVSNGGIAVAGPLTNNATAVTNGLFFVTLDFGGVFGGTNYWLEIGVRTNGSGAFTALNPRQAVMPAPMAIFAEGAGTVSGVLPGGGLNGTYPGAVALNSPSNSFNGSYTGNGGGLQNVNAATLGGLTPSNLLAMAANNVASAFASGSADTNLYLISQSISGWQSKMERIPWRGEPVSNQSDATNFISWFKTLPPMGFNIAASWDQHFLPHRVNAHLAFNTNNFPLGLQGYKNLLHTNGWRWLVWYDSSNATQEGLTSTPQFIDDIKTLVSWEPDILWIDEEGYRALLAAQILSTNSSAIQAMFGVSPLTPTPQDAHVISLGNAWRLHASSDVNSWSSFAEYADLVESSAWKFSGPNQFFYIGPEANGFGTATEVASGVVLQAMWGNMFLMGFGNNPVNSFGPYATITNKYVLALQGDPAVACARRVLVANGCWVYLKPLQNPDGPDFAVMVLNTNYYSTNLAFNLPALNNGQQSAGYLTAPSYSVYDLKADVAIGNFRTNIIVNGLASHDYALFSLAPMTQTYLAGNGARTDILNPSPGVVLGVLWTNTYGSPITLTIDGTLNLATGGSTMVTLTNLTTTESHVIAGSTIPAAGSSYFSYPYEMPANGVIQIIASNTGTAMATITRTTVKLKIQ